MTSFGSSRPTLLDRPLLQRRSYPDHVWSVTARRQASCPQHQAKRGSVVCSAHERSNTLSRRQLVQAAVTITGLSLMQVQPAKADLFRDLVKGYVRPEVAADKALMQLMDARGTLMELKALAATPTDSHERFEARRVLPGMATCLRQVSSAAPVAAALASGTASDATLNRMYGGTAAEGVSELSMAIPVYEAIGKVITISGRTIRKQAQASPEYAQAAIDVIEKLLAVCPPEDLAKAQEMRKARVKVA